MSEDLVKPLTGTDAFRGPAISRTVAVSQALQVLGIGMQLSGHRRQLGRVSVLRDLDVPKVRGLGPMVVTERECIDYVTALHGGDAALILTAQGDGFTVDEQARVRRMLWQDVHYGGDRQIAAAAFLRAAMHAVDEYDLLRVAAAAELTWNHGRDGRSLRIPQAEDVEAVRSVLESGLASDDEDVRVIADNALTGLEQAAEFSAGQPRMRGAGADGYPDEEAGGPHEWGERTSERESLIIHGTWANRRESTQWWRPPHGDFHQHLEHHDLGASLYRGDDTFEWSGSLKDHQREVAGKALRWWVDRPDGARQLHAAFAHSHGGTVLLWAAAHRDLRVGLMVALACPACEWTPTEWQEILDRVDVMISVRARHDPVLLADRLNPFFGGLRSASALKSTPDIVLEGAGHSDLHDAALWEKHHIADRVLQAAKNLGWS